MSRLLLAGVVLFLPCMVGAQPESVILDKVLAEQARYWGSINTIEYDYVLTYTRHLDIGTTNSNPSFNVVRGHLAFEGRKYRAVNSRYLDGEVFETEEVAFDGEHYYASNHDLKALAVGTRWKIPGDPVNTINPLTMMFNFGISEDDERSFRSIKSEDYWDASRVDCQGITAETDDGIVEAWFKLTHENGGAIQKVSFSKQLDYYPVKILTYVDPKNHWNAVQDKNHADWPGRLSAATTLDDFITTLSGSRQLVIPTKITSVAFDENNNVKLGYEYGIETNRNFRLNDRIDPAEFVIKLAPGWRQIDSDAPALESWPACPVAR